MHNFLQINKQPKSFFFWNEQWPCVHLSFPLHFCAPAQWPRESSPPSRGHTGQAAQAPVDQWGVGVGVERQLLLWFGNRTRQRRGLLLTPDCQGAGSEIILFSFGMCS